VSFQRCEDLVASGKFVQAVEHCSEAMQELMEDNDDGDGDDDDDDDD